MMWVNVVWLFLLGMCWVVCRYCVLVVLGGRLICVCLFMFFMLVWYSSVRVWCGCFCCYSVCVCVVIFGGIMLGRVIVFFCMGVVFFLCC